MARDRTSRLAERLSNLMRYGNYTPQDVVEALALCSDAAKDLETKVQAYVANYGFNTLCRVCGHVGKPSVHCTKATRDVYRHVLCCEVYLVCAADHNHSIGYQSFSVPYQDPLRELRGMLKEAE